MSPRILGAGLFVSVAAVVGLVAPAAVHAAVPPTVAVASPSVSPGGFVPLFLYVPHANIPPRSHNHPRATRPQVRPMPPTGSFR